MMSPHICVQIWDSVPMSACPKVLASTGRTLEYVPMSDIPYPSPCNTVQGCHLSVLSSLLHLQWLEDKCEDKLKLTEWLAFVFKHYFHCSYFSYCSTV